MASGCFSTCKNVRSSYQKVDVVQVAAFRWIQFNTAPPYISKFECIKWHKNIPVNCVSPIIDQWREGGKSHVEGFRREK